MSTAQKHLITPAEYLERERKAEFRSEYYRGEMFAMSGESPRHSLIKINMVSELRVKLRGSRCKAYDSDLRVKVQSTGLYTYPDTSVVCGELDFDDQYRDTIVNPTLVAEVLSNSTEAYDRGKKFDHYRTIETLQDYLLISQDNPKLELFSRNANGTWTLNVANDLHQTISLPSIGVSLLLADICENVDFNVESDTSSNHPA